MPFGLGLQKPHHYLGMVRVAWENRDRLGYAWRILRDGVCDGCALGTSGLRDWTIDGVHLCMVRLDLLRLNTIPALDPARLADVASLGPLDGKALRDLGRLPVPLVRRRDEPGFTRLSWDDAIALVAGRLRDLDPLRVAFYLTSRGIPNETYYVAQKVARFLGSPHVDNSARLCHAASTVAMKKALGHGASTGSYRDWLEADLIVFFGSNTPNNQPVTTKYLDQAKARGTEVAVVNPFREPGLARYWVPSSAKSAVFGTRLSDHWFEVDTGGDLAFLNGVGKALLDLPDGVDRDFVTNHTEGLVDLEDSLRGQDWRELERDCGCSRQEMERFAALLVARPKTIFVWSMGLTQHEHGSDTVQALCNVGLLRGLLGKRGSGLTPIRGHSGVQGGAEVGCVPVDDPTTLDRWREVWGFDPPRSPGLPAVEQIDAAAAGDIDLHWIVGGNFLDTVPDEARNRRALERPGLRIHHDIVLNRAMLVEPSDTVLLLPAATRYEIPGGVTETTTERRIVFSPEIPGPRPAEARPEWEVLCAVAARARPETARQITFAGTPEIRAEIARAIPLYAGIEQLAAKGDQFQWGGPTLFEEGRFATKSGKAHFVPVAPPERPRAAGELLVSTRRGHQFNSIVHGEVDGLTGAARDDVLISAEDAAELGIEDGATVELRSEHGAMTARVRVAAIKRGNLAVHWPEGMSLLSNAVDPQSHEPDYGTRVTVHRRR